MSVETDADRLAFFDTDDFAVVFVVGAHNVPGIFSDEYADVLDVAGTVPVFTCRSSDITTAGITRNTTGTINGTTYVVRNIKPDGTGMSMLVLEQQ